MDNTKLCQLNSRRYYSIEKKKTRDLQTEKKKDKAEKKESKRRLERKKGGNGESRVRRSLEEEGRNGGLYERQTSEKTKRVKEKKNSSIKKAKRIFAAKSLADEEILRQLGDSRRFELFECRKETKSQSSSFARRSFRGRF